VIYALNLFNFSIRAIVANSFADAPTQYNYIVSSINLAREDQAQLRHAVKAIQDKDRIRDCKSHEEKEGRQNCDLLNHFIVVGGPYFDPGPDLQSSLQNQVVLLFTFLNSLSFGILVI
jgi:hypothetical protein